MSKLLDQLSQNACGCNERMDNDPYEICNCQEIRAVLLAFGNAVKERAATRADEAKTLCPDNCAVGEIIVERIAYINLEEI